MLRFSTSDAAPRLRRLFCEAGYTSAGLSETLGTLTPPSPLTRTLPRLLDRTREPTLSNLLWRWFFLGAPVERAAAAQLAPEELIAALLDCGLLTIDDARLTPTALLAPFDDLLIAADLPHRMLSDEAGDLVLWLNPPAVRLLQFALRTPVEQTLDLCSGSGVQALAAARHSGRVVATDLNPRAAMFVEFNAQLNGIANLECLTGHLFEPAAGRTFDRIVCNPPFVLAPSRESIHSHNEAPLDEFCGRIIREAPRHLNEGGCLQMIFEWVEVEGQPWQQRLQEWFDGSGCDAWVLVESSQRAADYVAMRLYEKLPEGLAADVERFNVWMEYFREHHVAAVHSGLVFLRRRAGENWVRFEPLESNPRAAFGETIDATVRNFDVLQEADDERLLALRPRLAAGVRLIEEHRQSEDEWDTQSARLRQTGGLLRELGVTGEVAEFLVRCDGEHTVEQLADDLAIQTEAQFEDVRGECLALVRGMLERGFLLV